jgi:hypothetical protein
MPICLNSLCIGGMVIYLLGLPLCYIILRAMIYNRNDGEWVVMEKIITLIMCIGSWASILLYILLIAAIHINLIDPDKKCKW